MKYGIVVTISLITLALAGYFVKAKVQNDTSIAQDTKRVADSLDKERPRDIQLDCSLHRMPYNNQKYGTYLYYLGCSEKAK